MEAPGTVFTERPGRRRVACNSAGEAGKIAHDLTGVYVNLETRFGLDISMRPVLALSVGRVEEVCTALTKANMIKLECGSLCVGRDLCVGGEWARLAPSGAGDGVSP